MTPAHQTGHGKSVSEGPKVYYHESATRHLVASQVEEEEIRQSHVNMEVNALRSALTRSILVDRKSKYAIIDRVSTTIQSLGEHVNASSICFARILTIWKS